MNNSNLHYVDDILLFGYNLNFLNLLTISAITSGILVIISKNPVISILFLITLFFSISSYLMLLGITFIGLSYLLVYIGAVSILFLFILMLINVRVSELLTDTSNSIPLAFIIVVLFSYPIYQILPNNLFYSTDSIVNTIYLYASSIINTDLSNIFDYNINVIDTYDVSFVTSKSWDNSLLETSHITTLGNVIYTNYAMWLLISSIILLLSMIGAIIITISSKKIN